MMNKLLGAIQKGIQMGLEIQDDELDQPIFQKSEVASDFYANRAKQIRWSRESFVDLGLPSGTLWCKWNIGATCKDTPESWYGDYYAWGETEPKMAYTWTNYQYYSASMDALTKYNDDDNKSILEPIDDVVNVTLGPEFKMPTKEDFEELCSLPNEWVDNYNDIKGLNGRVFVGNNGNELFIPAAGSHSGHDKCGGGSSCELWSSSLYLDATIHAYYLYSYMCNISPSSYFHRYYAYPVRGVIKPGSK